MNSPTIDSLLQKRKTRRIDDSGNPESARRRLPISKLIAENFSVFDQLRLHLFHPDKFADYYATSKRARKLVDCLADLGWICTAGITPKWWITSELSQELRWYLQGGWLEEYAYCAHLAAGAEEAYYGQKIEWRVGEVLGNNEIDVLARKGDVLSFTSCKSIQSEQKAGMATAITRFLTEADYWDTHFANNQGRVLLVVTADFIDEIRNSRHRYPMVLARASVMSVDVLGLEDLAWERLVEKVAQHWMA
jgi:hypothetical protein